MKITRERVFKLREINDPDDEWTLCCCYYERGETRDHVSIETIDVVGEDGAQFERGS